MFGVSPVIAALVHGPPDAQPSVVFVASAVVGFNAVLQVIPEVVTVAPPFETIVPPPVPEV